ncbi:MAG: twin transmembrane helix small protein [Rhizomicrobium sp.]|jgi:ethanolamine transporter EutH
MNGKILVAIAIAVVLAILIAGLSTLWVGGDFARKWSNRLMRYRIIAQFVAVVIIMGLLYFSSH